VGLGGRRSRRGLNRVVDLVHAGQLDEAEQAARELLERYPDVHDGFERLDMVYEARGDRRQAAEYYRQALAFMQANADGYDAEAIDWMRARPSRSSRLREGRTVRPSRNVIRNRGDPPQIVCSHSRSNRSRRPRAGLGNGASTGAPSWWTWRSPSRSWVGVAVHHEYVRVAGDAELRQVPQSATPPAARSASA
jgi:tetratricopeptide (TPR) repeat protein